MRFYDLLSKLFYRRQHYLVYMTIERSLKNLLLLALAFIIVVVLWRTIWYLGGLAVFVIVVYFVYLLLKGNL